MTKSAYSRELPAYQNVIDGNLMDGEGSLTQRTQKLMKLQRLGIVDKKFDFPKLTREPKAFDLVEHAALNDANSKARGKGFMLRHVKGDNPRMQEVWYEGDPAVCWDPFKAPGFTGTINKEVGMHEETAKIRDGERLVVLRPDGTIAHLDGRPVEDAGEKASSSKKSSTRDDYLQDPKYHALIKEQYQKDLEKTQNQKNANWSC
jgi:hypothetical protein